MPSPSTLVTTDAPHVESPDADPGGSPDASPGESLVASPGEPPDAAADAATAAPTRANVHEGDPVDASHLVLLHAIADLTRIQREVTLVIAGELDCPRAALGIVRMLDRDGQSGVGDLAQHLHVDISVASRQVSALVDVGLVERSTPDTLGADRRTRSVRLTPAGAAFASRIWQAIDAHSRSAFASWSPSEIATAAEQVHKIAAAVTAEHTRSTSAPRESRTPRPFPTSPPPPTPAPAPPRGSPLDAR